MIQANLSRLGAYILIFTLAAVYSACSAKSPSQATIRVWIETPPATPDPLAFDTTAHHILFRPVLNGLVSTYKTGEITPEIASRWSVSDDKLTWKFEIRRNLKFSNGDPITAASVVKAWSRLGMMLKRKKSHSDLFSNLREVDGISQEGDQLVVVRLSKPIPNLLETIGFGLYSIPHESDFDPVTGVWKDKSRVVSSGPYLYEENEGRWKLTLRKDYPSNLIHPKPIHTYLVSTDPAERMKADILLGFDIEKSLSGNLKFIGGPSTNIAYIYCLTWKAKGSPCAKRETRQILRAAYLERYRAATFQVHNSFFPLAMTGIQALEELPPEGKEPLLADITLTYAVSKSRNPLLRHFPDASQEISRSIKLPARETPLSWEQFDKIVDSGFTSREYDIAAMYTGILVEDAIADIRFMFLSKEGIRLPDEDGSIRKELSKPDPSPQTINAAIWKQAIIWPIGHFSLGIWVKEHLDVSAINVLLPPTGLQYIGLKN